LKRTEVFRESGSTAVSHGSGGVSLAKIAL
jgi:hypothetical protein